MRPLGDTTPVLVCAECGRESENAVGWRALRADDPTDEDERPEIGFFCPACAAREFGRE
jgi:hypothetical protein